MKWIVAVYGLVAGALFIYGLRRGARIAPWLWVAIGVLPFIVSSLHLYFALVSWPTWSGYCKGYEVSAIDGLIIIALFDRRLDRSIPWMIVPLLIYGATIILSVQRAAVPTAAEFPVWQLARMIALVTVAAQACTNPRVPPALMLGVGIGVCIEMFTVLDQRYAQHILQTPGTFVHQNTLGLITNLAVMPFAAVFIARPRNFWAAIIAVAGIVIGLMTVSRATQGLYVLGLALLVVISLVRSFTLQRLTFALATVGVVGVATPVAMATLSQRFKEVPLDPLYDERAAFELAASMLFKDHPWGIGANHYVMQVNLLGYNDIARVAWTSFDATVHNVYLLTSAELGYPGLAALWLMQLVPIFVAFRWGWRDRGDIRSDVLIGAGVGLILTTLHNSVEWIFVTMEVQYVYALSLGLVAGLSMRLRAGQLAERRARASRPQPGVLGPALAGAALAG